MAARSRNDCQFNHHYEEKKIKQKMIAFFIACFLRNPRAAKNRDVGIHERLHRNGEQTVYDAARLIVMQPKDMSRNKYRILLVFWPVFCVAATVT